MNSDNGLATIFKVNTRRERKRTLASVQCQIIAIRDAEEQYIENAPENLRGSKNYEIADEAVAILDEIIIMIDDVYPL